VGSELRTQLRVLARNICCCPFSLHRAADLDHNLIKGLCLQLVASLKSLQKRLQCGNTGLQGVIGAPRIARLLLDLSQTCAKDYRQQEQHEDQRLG
jgi:hypothetical protein